MERRERKFPNIIAYSWVDFDLKVYSHNYLRKLK